MIPRTTISTMVAPRTTLSRSSSFRQACKVVKPHSVARRWGPRVRKLFGFVFVFQTELGRGSEARIGAKGGRVSGIQLGPDSGVSGPDVYIWGRIPAQIWGRIPAQIRAGCRPRLGAGFRPRFGAGCRSGAQERRSRCGIISTPPFPALRQRSGPQLYGPHGFYFAFFTRRPVIMSLRIFQ